MANEKIIKYSDIESATYRTDINGWVSRTGHYFGKDEHLARYDGCTHKECQCGRLMEKFYTLCGYCRHEKDVLKYASFPIQDWDEITPITMFDSGDKYFHMWDEVFEYLDEINEFQEDNEKSTLADLMLCHTKRWKFPAFDLMDFLSDSMFEDFDESDIPDRILETYNAFSMALQECENPTYGIINIAVDISDIKYEEQE